MVDTVRESQAFPVNELGEIVLQSGIGTANVVGFLSSSQVPSDFQTNKMVVRFPENIAGSVSSAQMNSAIAAASGVLTVTWVGLQLITGMTIGDTRFVTDVGSGSTWQYDGSRWKPISGIVTIYSNSNSITKTDSDTLNSVLASFNIFGKLIGINDSIEYEYKITHTGGNINIGASYGVTNVNSEVSTGLSHTVRGVLTAQGITNSQVSTGNNPSFGSGSNPLSSSAEDSTLDKLFSINTNFIVAGTGSNSASLKSLIVKLIRG
jgi:hypothetical protein